MGAMTRAVWLLVGLNVGFVLGAWWVGSKAHQRQEALLCKLDSARAENARLRAEMQLREAETAYADFGQAEARRMRQAICGAIRDLEFGPDGAPAELAMARKLRGAL